MPQHLTVLLCQLALLPALSVANGVQHTKLAPGKGKVVRILALGDSLTEGVSDYADKKRYPYADEIVRLAAAANVANFEVVEEGVSGELVVPTMVDRCKQILANAQAAGHDYTHVIIEGGFNDIGWGKKTTDIFDGLLHMYREAEHHGAHVIGMTLYEYGKPPPTDNPHDAARQELNALIRHHFDSYAQGQGVAPGKLTLFDLDKSINREMVPEDKSKGDSYYTDALHLTPVGYKYMGKLIWEQVLKKEVIGSSV